MRGVSTEKGPTVNFVHWKSLWYLSGSLIKVLGDHTLPASSSSSDGPVSRSYSVEVRNVPQLLFYSRLPQSSFVRGDTPTPSLRLVHLSTFGTQCLRFVQSFGPRKGQTSVRLPVKKVLDLYPWSPPASRVVKRRHPKCITSFLRTIQSLGPSNKYTTQKKIQRRTL